MKRKLTFALISAVLFSGQAFAQSYSNLIIFGDSNSDSGRYKYIPSYTGGALATYGAFTTNPGAEWTVGLGQKFGVTVIPTSAPGGGNNYAAGGARVSYTAANSNAWSATSQVSAYLATNSSIADPNALYIMSIGVNDLKTTTTGGAGNIVDPQNISAITTLGRQTANLVGSLYSAGARNFLIPNMNAFKSAAAASAAGYSYNAVQVASRDLYSQTVWNNVAAQGINFVPADWSTVYNYIALNPARFGITNTNVNTPACGTTTASINCGPSNYVTPTADQTYLYADGPLSSNGGGHLTTAGQKIETDYYYGLLVAPGQVSMLANQASIGQIAMNNSYLDQAGYSFRANAPQTLGAWVLGGAQQVNMTGSQTSTSSAPYNGAAGMDYQYNQNILLGGFVGYGQAQVNYNTSGNFTQSGTTLGAYSSYKDGGIWANGLVAYNWLNSNVNRITPIGITSFSNASTVNGSNTSVAVQTGYNFDYSVINHGPVIGYAYVNTSINGFTESGNFNSLQFGSQNINAQVGSVGYQVQAKVGDWLPFAKAIYNSQLGNLDRLVTTTLTTVAAPSYTMPAMGYGRNWTNLTAGIGYQIDPKTVIRASFTEQVAQQSVNSYNAIVSLSSHF
ncbi:autotransporter outer membrane beta-barrel domain-containing protein [Polynucleobacter sp. UK-Gri1-W3]|uniref:autotransporter outer membrane beta-barrel domain-containing protein n=1 Tax=Polynucleobacter sp. UK-Gri1-W3 TaxID=1819737 RepID=UPI001C0E6D0B|nr:autotransporter domain-containing protein [Polynucleobacter sp. UK-Gri1-W3]MBU3537414.1 autotransporter domain-containing protein [Polynucleobacter sp. UK-Gri1-W3]